MHIFLICYDISSNKIRGKVFRFLKKCATPVQESVFIFRRTRKELLKIEKFIVDMLDEDDCLIVMPCCDKCYGKSKFFGKKQVELILD